MRKDISQNDYDMLTLNLRVDGVCIKELQFDWRYEVRPINAISSRRMALQRTPQQLCASIASCET